MRVVVVKTRHAAGVALSKSENPTNKTPYDNLDI
jgi:hypothetical protein